MDDSPEAAWLRTHWNRDYLGGFEGQWIAVSGQQVVASGDTPQAVSESVRRLLPKTSSPLYAFVVLGPLQP